METDHLETHEKLQRAQTYLSAIDEEELNEEDRERIVPLFMELEDLTGKYEPDDPIDPD